MFLPPSLLDLLIWEDKTLVSAEGVQQGDLLGPMLFFLSIHQLAIYTALSTMHVFHNQSIVEDILWQPGF